MNTNFPTQVEISDSNGRLLKSSTYKNQEYIQNFKSLHKGTYHVKFSSPSSVYMKKIVKK